MMGFAICTDTYVMILKTFFENNFFIFGNFQKAIVSSYPHHRDDSFDIKTQKWPKNT